MAYGFWDWLKGDALGTAAGAAAVTSAFMDDGDAKKYVKIGASSGSLLANAIGTYKGFSKLGGLKNNTTMSAADIQREKVSTGWGLGASIAGGLGNAADLVAQGAYLNGDRKTGGISQMVSGGLGALGGLANIVKGGYDIAKGKKARGVTGLISGLTGVLGGVGAMGSGYFNYSHADELKALGETKPENWTDEQKKLNEQKALLGHHAQGFATAGLVGNIANALIKKKWSDSF